MARKMDTEVRQEQIAEAALRVVGERGVRALNMGAIARRVGIVPSAIYRHFQGKEEVLDAVVNLIGTRLKKNVAAVCDETDDPVERLHMLLERHVRLIRENEAIPRVVFSESVYGGVPERKRRLYRVIKSYLDRVGDIVAEGQRQGRLSDGLEPDQAAVMFLGMIQPGAILWHLSDGEFDVTRQAEKAWEVFRNVLET